MPYESTVGEPPGQDDGPDHNPAERADTDLVFDSVALPDGSVLVAGKFQGKASFPAGCDSGKTHTAQGENDLFVVKLAAGERR